MVFSKTLNQHFMQPTWEQRFAPAQLWINYAIWITNLKSLYIYHDVLVADKAEFHLF